MNSWIQPHNVNKESYRIHYLFIEASCKSKTASVVHTKDFTYSVIAYAMYK